MKPNLEIIDVLMSPSRLSDPDLERGNQQPWTDVAITMRNRSKSEAVHVVSKVTQLTYDSGTRMLVLGMIVPRFGLGLRRITPPTARLEPGESIVVHVAVPLVIRRLVEGGVKRSIESIDASGMEHVTCRVAWGNSPLSELWVPAADDMERRLATWEKSIEKSFERSLPVEPEKRTSETNKKLKE